MDSIESRLNSVIERHRAPGASIAWSVNDGPVNVCSVGHARLSPPVEMSADTVMPWFSVTKLFTATAILQLVERGKLDLDEPVSACLPGTFHDPVAALTPRQLLSHTSGLANPMPLRWVHLVSEPGPDLKSMTLRLLSRERRLRFEPGTRYAYSNLGYLVLGLLIEAASGIGFDEYMSRHVLQPLGAAATGFDLPADGARGYNRTWSLMGLAARLLMDRKIFGATGSGLTELQPFELDGGPYGGLVGPVTSMLTLGRAMLADGYTARGRVLDAASVRLALTPVRSQDNEEFPIGLGWHLGQANGEHYAKHIGGGLGFRSELRIYPRRGCAVAVIANATSFDTAAIAEFVVQGCNVSAKRGSG